MYFFNYDDPTKTSLASQFGYTGTASKPNTNVSEEDWDPLGKARYYKIRNQQQLIDLQKRHMTNPSGVWDENFDKIYNQYVDSLKQYQKQPVYTSNTNKKADPLLDVSNMPIFQQSDVTKYRTIDGKTYLVLRPKNHLRAAFERENLVNDYNTNMGQKIASDADFFEFGSYEYAYDPDSGCFRRVIGNNWALDSRWLPADGFKKIQKQAYEYPERELYKSVLKKQYGVDIEDIYDPYIMSTVADKKGGVLIQHRKQGGRLINKHFTGGPMNTYNEPEKINKRTAYLPNAHVIVPDNTRVVNPYRQYPARWIDERPVVQMSPADQAREAARIKDEVNMLRQGATEKRKPSILPVKSIVEPMDNTRVAPRADVIDFQQRLRFQQGGQMAPATAGPSGAQDIKMQVMQLVQAAMSGDQQATQQINQIMQAAQQGNAQAAQIAQLINQVAQELQGQAAPAARMGAKLNYIRSLKYARGGKACGSKVKADKCGGKAKKR